MTIDRIEETHNCGEELTNGSLPEWLTLLRRVLRGFTVQNGAPANPDNTAVHCAVCGGNISDYPGDATEPSFLISIKQPSLGRH